MRGVYRLTGEATGVTAAKSLFLLTADAANPLEILSCRAIVSDEDTSEQIHLQLARITTIGSAAGTADVPKPTEEGSSAFGGSALVTITVEPTAYDGLTDSIAQGGANKLGGWEYVPLPEERPIITASDVVGLQLIDAIATSSTVTFEITFREIG
jgi:hypothetical protein